MKITAALIKKLKFKTRDENFFFNFMVTKFDDTLHVDYADFIARNLTRLRVCLIALDFISSCKILKNIGGFLLREIFFINK